MYSGGRSAGPCRGVCVKRLGAWHKRPYTVNLLFMPDRPPRLDWVFQRYDPPLYFVTFNTHNRQKLLANSHVQNALVNFAHEGEARGIGLGRYVIMPDHVHLFVRGNFDFALRQWVRMLKRVLSSAIPAEPPHWQQGFFDHLIRHGESYAEKWEYVRQNPVRAGHAPTLEAWPYAGHIHFDDPL